MDKIGDHFKLDGSKKLSNVDAIKMGKSYRFTVLTERLIRLEYEENGKFRDDLSLRVRNRSFPMPEFNFVETSTSIEISTKYFKLVYEKEAPIVGPKDNPSAYFYIEIKPSNEIWYPGKKDVLNYLGNEKAYNTVDNAEGLFSGNTYFVLDDSKTLAMNDAGTSYFDGDRTDIYFASYDIDFGSALNDYFTLTGKAPMIPKYAFGNILIDDEKIDELRIRDNINLFRENDIYLSTIVLGKWNKLNSEGFKNKTSHLFDDTLIKDPKTLFNDIHKSGLFLGLKVDVSEGFNQNEFNYIELAKFLSPDANGIIPAEPEDARFIDSYLKFVLRPLEAIGVDFFFNNYLGSDNAMKNLNYYLSYDLCRNNKRPFIIGRNSTIAPHQTPISYIGDFLNNKDSLDKIERLKVSFTNMGASLFMSPINGTKQIDNSPFMFIRSLQNSVFSPVSSLYFNDDNYALNKPWDFGGEYLELARRFLNKRQRLVPYLYSNYVNYAMTGYLMMQPLYFLNPSLIHDVNYRNEYLLGDSLLIAPITKDVIPGTRITPHKFYLPGGTWYNYLDGKSYQGDKKYDAFIRLSEYPVFVKAGSLIASNDDYYPYAYINPINLKVEVFPGSNGSYTLYEDDGLSRKYKERFYFKTNFNFVNKINQYELNIKPLEGKGGVIPAKRNYKIVFINCNIPEEVHVFMEEKNVKYNMYKNKKNLVIEIKNIDTLKPLNILIKSKNNLEIVNEGNVKKNLSVIMKDFDIRNDLKPLAINYIKTNEKWNWLDKKILTKKKGISEIDLAKIVELKNYLEENDFNIGEAK